MTQTDAHWPDGTGEMAALIGAHDWAGTPLGPVSGWSSRLKVMVEQVLAHPLVASLVCGPERILIYNDAAASLYGDRHPAALGRPLVEIFPEGWATVAPYYARAFAGETVQVVGQPVDTRGEDAAADVFDAVLVPVREEDGRPAYVHAVASEIGGRMRAESALRASEERQIFLLKLSDALRPLTDPIEVQAATSLLLGEHLSAAGVNYGVVDETAEAIVVAREFRREGSGSSIGSHSLDAFAWMVRILRQERNVVVDDAASSPLISVSERPAVIAVGHAGFVVVPLIKDGRLVGALTVLSAAPRHWTRDETELIEEAAERTWDAVERARAEDALHASEARFAQFAACSSDGLWIRDAATLAMEYVSPAIRDIYGLAPEAILGDLRLWAANIVPEDRGGALEHLERARHGEAVTHEFRILRPTDGAFRWIRDTDFPLLDEHGRVQRIGGIAEDVTDAKQAAEHQAILLLELQHRVRNILALIRSVADRTGDTAGDVDDYRDRLQGRLRAFARVQTLLTHAANVGVDLATLIRTEVEAQAGSDTQFVIAGPDILIAPKTAEILNLAVHELTTNAVKHGAFSHAAGRLGVTWRVCYEEDEPWLHLDWIETCAAPTLRRPERKGFGTSLIEQRIPYELNGNGTLAFEPDGVRCRLEFPLRRGNSILETDAVTLSTTIAGGALDMVGEANLGGCQVLVVEDDYFLATDLARALSKVGGTVMGPVGDEDKALTIIAGEAPCCAVVDINLGNGARFAVAEALQERGVPFVFVTGYDDVVIPARFDGVARLRKPVEFRQVVQAAARMCEA